MITKITESNSPQYTTFLSKAYQYLEFLERSNAYQALSKWEYKKAYDYLNSKGLINKTSDPFIDEEDISIIKEASSLKEGYLFAKYRDKYFTEYPENEDDFKTSVYIIEEGHRDDDENKTDAERAFSTYDQYIHYTDKYTEYEILFGSDAVAVSPIKIIDPDDRSTEGSFLTLEQYFNYIEVIKNSGRSSHFLLSLPLDEGLLNINANTRLITIPKEFVSTVVQNDSLAETIVFTMDRFVENVDLSNVDVIYVQWTAPGDDGLRQEATKVELMDSDANTIKFGWPISREITSHPGQVQFSVVFLIYNPNNPGEINYRLNTLPNSFEVRPALQPNINQKITNVGTDFYYAIRNNRYPGKVSEAPKPPIFDPKVGLDLEDNDPTEKLKLEKQEDVLKFEAQAIITDVGQINYTWYVQPEGCSLAFNCAGGLYVIEPNKKITENDYKYFGDEGPKYFKESSISTEAEKFYELKTETSQKVPYNAFGVISTAFKKFIKTDEKQQLNAQDTYFVSTTGETEDEVYVQVSDSSFKRYTGEPEQKDLPKYEKFTVFQMPYNSTGDQAPIVGTYFVTATASIPGRHSETKKLVTYESEPARSNACHVKGPVELAYTDKGDLSDINFLLTNVKIDAGTVLSNTDIASTLLKIETDEQKTKFTDVFSTEVEDSTTGEKNHKKSSESVNVEYKETTLSTNLEQTSGEVKYYWHTSMKKSDLEDSSKDENTKIAETDTSSSSILLTKPGWYKQTVVAKKNRKLNHLTSNISRVTYAPREVSLALSSDCQTQANHYSAYEDNLVYAFDPQQADHHIVLTMIPYLWVNSLGETITNNEYLALSADDKKAYTNYMNHENKVFYSDNIEYRWYRREILDEVSSSYRDTPLTLRDSALVSPPDNFDTVQPASITLKPRLAADGKTLLQEAYVCKATNVIDKKKSQVSEAMVFLR